MFKGSHISFGSLQDFTHIWVSRQPLDDC